MNGMSIWTADTTIIDTVNHDILLKRKLEMYGPGESAFALLHNYLTERTQKCNLQGMLSK
jgi:hypothetical protein